MELRLKLTVTNVTAFRMEVMLFLSQFTSFYFHFLFLSQFTSFYFKSTEVCIESKSTSASLPPKGLVTKHTTVKFAGNSC